MPIGQQRPAHSKHVDGWWRALPASCLLLMLLIQDLSAVKITNISVPRWIQNGTTEEVILDCEYTESADDKRLVVKWFLNDEAEPIYQWIPEFKTSTYSTKHSDKKPEGPPIITSGPNKEPPGRVLRIRNPTTEFTGQYRCDVGSLESQDSAQAHMIVYAPPEELNFFVTENEMMEGVNITCEAEDVFPLPQLRVYQITPGDAIRRQLPGKKNLTSRKNGVFDIKIVSELQGEAVQRIEPLYFECELLIQGTDFVTKRRVQFLPGGVVVLTEEPTVAKSHRTKASSFLISILIAVVVFSLS